jgi:hypothetical protein
MKFGILFGMIAAIMIVACTPDQKSPLYLTIFKPHDGDTVRTLINPVEGKAYPGATVTIGFGKSSADTTLLPNDTGGFAGMYKIPLDEPGYNYSVYITAIYNGLSIQETRTVFYATPAN